MSVQTLDGATLRTVALGGMKVRSLRWAGSTHLLIIASTTLRQRGTSDYKYEMGSVLSLNVSTGKLVEVLADQKSTLGNVMGYFGDAEADGRRFGFFRSQQFNRPGAANLYKVDLDSGATTAVDGADASDESWVLDEQGRIVARSRFAVSTNTWSLYGGTQAGPPALSKATKLAEMDVVGLGRSADTVLIEDQTGDTDLLMEAPVKGTGLPQTLFADLKAARPYFSADHRTLLGAVDPYRGNADFFDPLLKARFDAARKPFAKYQTTLASYDAGFQRMVLFTEGADESGTYWLVDLSSGKARSLGQAYPDIQPADVGPARLVQYKAADGLQIEAVLTLPPGRKAERLPLVVLPHGGPMDIADRVGFDWWAQAFASRGYAVLQPNYRGSGSYGAAFRRAGYGEWGRKMQTDLSDGVADLAAKGVVDPKRVCIVGASYGGYAALAGVTLQHGLYRCAVSVGGVSDLGTMMWRVGHNRARSVAKRWEERAMGASWSGDESLAARSPLHQAAQADAPILLIHGKDDTVVPIGESEAMDVALRQVGKPHAFLKLDGEDHWLSNPSTRTQMLQASVDFVMANDPPG